MAITDVPVAGGSVWPSDTVKDTAESVGISALPEDVAQALAADVEYRLHELIEESIKFMRHGKRTKLKVADVDHALKAMNLEPLWGFAHADALSFRKANTATGPIWVPDDEEIDLTRILRTPLPPIPPDVSYSAHWLAIEGVQPAIPENPTPTEIAAVNRNKTDATQQATLAAAATGGAAANAQSVDVRPLVKHVLSRELQLYFERLTTAAADPDEAMRLAALGCLRQDTGLTGLVPYLVQWVAERVVNNLKGDATVLDQMLSVLNAMLDNQTLFVEPYMMPSVLTCLLSSSIEATQAAVDLRRHAASLLGAILQQYSPSYPTLHPRVLKAILRALIAEDSTPGARLGAIEGLRALGSASVQTVLGRSTNLRSLSIILEATRDQPETLELINGVVEALRKAFVGQAEIEPISEPDDFSETFGAIFGAELEKLGEDGQAIAKGVLAEDARAAKLAEHNAAKRKRDDTEDKMDVA